MCCLLKISKRCCCCFSFKVGTQILLCLDLFLLLVATNQYSIVLENSNKGVLESLYNIKDLNISQFLNFSILNEFKNEIYDLVLITNETHPIKCEIISNKRLQSKTCDKRIPDLYDFIPKISVEETVSVLLIVNIIIFVIVIAALLGISKKKPTWLIPYILLRMMYVVVTFLLPVTVLYSMKKQSQEWCELIYLVKITSIFTFLTLESVLEFLSHFCLITDIIMTVLQIYFLIVVFICYRGVAKSANKRKEIGRMIKLAIHSEV